MYNSEYISLCIAVLSVSKVIFFISYVYLNVRSSKKEFTELIIYTYIGYTYHTFITISMLFNTRQKG
jgi:hypothetical protein